MPATNRGRLGASVPAGADGTLSELEIQVTTLKADLASHAPHHHANEELVIRKEVEVVVHRALTRTAAGSIVLGVSNEEHALRNVATGPATDQVINWKVRKGK